MLKTDGLRQRGYGKPRKPNEPRRGKRKIGARKSERELNGKLRRTRRQVGAKGMNERRPNARKMRKDR